MKLRVSEILTLDGVIEIPNECRLRQPLSITSDLSQLLSMPLDSFFTGLNDGFEAK